MKITANEIKQISLNRGRNDLCEVIADFITEKGDEFHLDTPMRVKHFLGQVCVESGFMTRLEENLNYSATRLTQVWPSRFPTVAAAQPYAMNPRALAMKTYGNRKDLGNTSAEDGWTFRGRTPKQLTGRDNYTRFNTWMHKRIPEAPDFVKNPDLLLDLQWTMYPALWFWDSNNCWQYADKDDCKGVTRSINGGLIGYEDRLKATAYAAKILNMRTDPSVITIKPKQPDPLLMQYQGYLKKLSVAMKNIKLDPGIVDGWNGTKTEAAVEEVQRITNIIVDGKLGPNTRLAIDKLRSKYNVA